MFDARGGLLRRMRGLARLALLSSLLFAPCASPAFAEDYTPTPAESAAVDKLTGEYFKAQARRDYAASYAMLAPTMQASITPSEWTRAQEATESERGAVTRRERTRISWYLDPPDSVGPGVYAAVDFKASATRAPVISEYVIWFRPRGERRFSLLRHEAKLIGQTPAAPVEDDAGTSLEEAAPGDLPIGFATVAEARAALGARKGVARRPMSDGWLVLQDAKAVWSFAPSGHPAYPAVVRREAVKDPKGKPSVDMRVLCEAPKTACDRLVKEFKAMNEKLLQELRAGAASPAESEKPTKPAKPAKGKQR